jgi:xylulokinase
VSRPPFGGDPVSHMLHLERDQPQTAAAARWYLEPVDYLSMRFCGRAAATLASMSAAWLTDNRKLGRLKYGATDVSVGVG